MAGDKKVIVYQCVYCGIIKKFPDVEPCLGCGREYWYLRQIKISQKDWLKIRKRQKDLEEKADQSVEGWLKLREYGAQLLDLYSLYRGEKSFQ